MRISELAERYGAKPTQARYDALIEGIKESDKSIVSVVRCKDCKEWTQTAGDEEFSIGRCEFLGHDLVMNKGFCAWGVRKDDADN